MLLSQNQKLQMVMEHLAELGELKSEYLNTINNMVGRFPSYQRNDDVIEELELEKQRLQRQIFELI